MVERDAIIKTGSASSTPVWWLWAEDLAVPVEQDPCEVVNGSNSTEGHGSIPAPHKVWPKHHSQVHVVHLVHFTLRRHLEMGRRPIYIRTAVGIRHSRRGV